MPQKLSQDIINAAIAGYEHQRSQIDDKIAELRAMLPGSTRAAAPESASPRRRTLSAAARKKIAMAQKARWAKARGESPAGGETAPKPKRRISEEGMKRIIAATKKRWALKRAEAAKAAKSAPAKKSPASKASAKKAAVKKAAAKKVTAKGAPETAPASPTPVAG